MSRKLVSWRSYWPNEGWTVRRWALKFGPGFARGLRRSRRQCHRNGVRAGGPAIALVGAVGYAVTRIERLNKAGQMANLARICSFIDNQHRQAVFAGIVDERTTADRVPSTLDELFHQVEQLERFLHPLLRRQQHDVRRHVHRRFVTPLLRVASAHKPLGSFDPPL